MKKVNTENDLNNIYINSLKLRGFLIIINYKSEYII